MGIDLTFSRELFEINNKTEKIVPIIGLSYIPFSETWSIGRNFRSTSQINQLYIVSVGAGVVYHIYSNTLIIEPAFSMEINDKTLLAGLSLIYMFD